MADALCKWRGIAPWVVAILTVSIQIAAVGYWSGSTQAHQAELDRQVALLRTDHDRRLAAVESSDKEQAKQLGDAASRLARIESGVDWLRQAAIRQDKGR